ncbi:hypothetical protein AA309_13265 [Microvirga vignae]|uniref:Uncharacterized protein n=1 Tax=Microvirga vignae TaxID=1225564 RepID=A0A0H1RJ57_9HYPH|nr:hypothetical protein AA309_13265 [Microvirga vignae]
MAHQKFDQQPGTITALGAGTSLVAFVGLLAHLVVQAAVEPAVAGHAKTSVRGEPEQENSREAKT